MATAAGVFKVARSRLWILVSISSRGSSGKAFKFGQQVIGERLSRIRRTDFEFAVQRVRHIPDLHHLRHAMSMHACSSHVKTQGASQTSRRQVRSQAVKLVITGLTRLAIAAELLALACVTALAMIYFVLLLPVSRELNLLATFLRLVGIAIEAMATLSLASALFPLGTGAYLRAFTPEQLQAMAYLAIKSHGHGYAVALLFFGFTFLFHGRSSPGYSPRSLCRPLSRRRP